MDDKVRELVEKLNDKLSSVGENLSDHLEGMLYSDYLNYWDYVGIDALLNLQKPRTKYPDEMTFIIYHQITELFFKIILHEIEQIGFEKENHTAEAMIKRLKRINNYFSHLTQSFDVLISGMEHEQFMRFRTALTPSSGFQSIQYRLIELWSTEFKNLVSKNYREKFTSESSIEEMYQYIYWKAGATDATSAKKTLTLTQFEDKYSKLIIRKGNEFRDKNIWYKYTQLPIIERKNELLMNEMKQFDVHANINWPLAHYRYASKYLVKGDKIAKSTGNTNWREYLPPKFQKQIFYPGLWTAEEVENWGKTWVENVYLSKFK